MGRYGVAGRWVLRLVLVASVVLSGCDTLEETGEDVLLDRDVTFRFETGPVQAGQEVIVNSTAAEDLTGDLAGFSPGEILSATVTSIRLERVQPAGLNLDAITNSASLFLTASGPGEAQAGRLPDTPGSAQANLPELTSADVGAFLRAPAFRGRLRFTPLQANPEGYTLSAQIGFRIHVPGV